MEELSKTGRIRGLDALRFWCALWVIFGHFGFLPLIDGVDLTHAAGRVSRALYNNLISGQAAVIVFFVISGFCIHYPFRHRSTVPLVPFFARRYLRILIPVAIAIVLSRPAGVELRLLDQTVLWSLVCEEIYYAIYPVLLRLRLRFGWRRMIAVSYLASILIALTNLRAGNYPAFGPGLNWLLALPCWLLGCDLAESYQESPSGAVVRVPIVYWRFGAWVLSIFARALKFHSLATYPLTLNIFAFYVYFWLRQEICRAEKSQASWIERAGLFSYSMYLIHPAAHEVWRRWISIPSLGSGVDWLVHTAFILAMALIFYLVVEHPSHRFARRTYRWLAPRFRSASTE